MKWFGRLSPLHPRCRCVIVYREIRGGLNAELSPNSPSANLPGSQNPQSFKDVGIRHYAVIQVILANAPSLEAAQVWRKFESKIKIGAKHTKGGAYHRDGLLYFDIEEVAKGDVAAKPYQTLFHERAHNIDFLNCVGNKFFSEEYQAGALLSALRTDFARLTEEERAYFGFDSAEQALQSLKKRWTQEHSIPDRASLSDLLDAYTHGKYNLGISHGSVYWSKFGDAVKSRETFADFMDAALANPESYKILQSYLPLTTKIFKRMLDELLK